MARLGALWNSIQQWLFPALEDELGELDEKRRLFVAVCEACAPGARMGHVALTDHNPRRGEKREFAPAEAVRYRKRGSAERVFSRVHG